MKKYTFLLGILLALPSIAMAMQQQPASNPLVVYLLRNPDVLRAALKASPANQARNQQQPAVNDRNNLDISHKERDARRRRHDSDSDNDDARNNSNRRQRRHRNRSILTLDGGDAINTALDRADDIIHTIDDARADIKKAGKDAKDAYAVVQRDIRALNQATDEKINTMRTIANSLLLKTTVCGVSALATACGLYMLCTHRHNKDIAIGSGLGALSIFGLTIAAKKL